MHACMYVYSVYVYIYIAISFGKTPSRVDWGIGKKKQKVSIPADPQSDPRTYPQCPQVRAYSPELTLDSNLPCCVTFERSYPMKNWYPSIFAWFLS